ncbi:hypothetical protein PISMIDRAFT_22876 [Pisolithus microcarpus 441]|uniref:Uncharacterized protein n=1 Tax=Pisolithus microcarpus 441 TaxID=765257 RepID=A0A0C9ZH34_9AGAM|nr:hypothetical protein BKA83DRAFT_4128350 [Pisolithus microcarpus]KAI6037433.1 hypothetical protein BKA83DRAFT_22876 [Pisolithus microcarpus]KIK25319.1 hypothetical protein PISMIDRAFT_22876 [Pisolithus microcarpus 441]
MCHAPPSTLTQFLGFVEVVLAQCKDYGSALDLKNATQGMANIVECTRPAANHLGICTKYLDNVIRSCLYSSVLQESQGWKWWTGGSIFCSKVALSYLQVLWVRDEIWRVRTVPASATLSIVAHDKDLGATVDDYISKCVAGTKRDQVLTSSEGPKFFSLACWAGWYAILAIPRSPWKLYIKDGSNIIDDQVQPFGFADTTVQSIFLGLTWVAVCSGIHDEAALKESVEACTLRPVEKKGDSTRALA